MSMMFPDRPHVVLWQLHRDVFDILGRIFCPVWPFPALLRALLKKLFEMGLITGFIWAFMNVSRGLNIAGDAVGIVAVPGAAWFTLILFASLTLFHIIAPKFLWNIVITFLGAGGAFFAGFLTLFFIPEAIIMPNFLLLVTPGVGTIVLVMVVVGLTQLYVFGVALALAVVLNTVWSWILKTPWFLYSLSYSLYAFCCSPFLPISTITKERPADKIMKVMYGPSARDIAAVGKGLQRDLDPSNRTEIDQREDEEGAGIMRLPSPGIFSTDVDDTSPPTEVSIYSSPLTMTPRGEEIVQDSFPNPSIPMSAFFRPISPHFLRNGSHPEMIPSPSRLLSTALPPLAESSGLRELPPLTEYLKSFAVPIPFARKKFSFRLALGWFLLTALFAWMALLWPETVVWTTLFFLSATIFCWIFFSKFPPIVQFNLHPTAMTALMMTAVIVLYAICIEVDVLESFELYIIPGRDTYAWPPLAGNVLVDISTAALAAVAVLLFEARWEIFKYFGILFLQTSITVISSIFLTATMCSVVQLPAVTCYSILTPYLFPGFAATIAARLGGVPPAAAGVAVIASIPNVIFLSFVSKVPVLKNDHNMGVFGAIVSHGFGLYFNIQTRSIVPAAPMGAAAVMMMGIIAGVWVSFPFMTSALEGIIGPVQPVQPFL